MATKVFGTVHIEDGTYVIFMPGYGRTTATTSADVEATALDFLYCCDVTDPVLRLNWDGVVREMRQSERWGLLA